MKQKLFFSLLFIAGIFSFGFASNPDGDGNSAIIGVYPDKGHNEVNIGVTISGENTYFTQGSSVIKFTQGTLTVFADITNVIDNNTLEAVVVFPDWADPGYYDVYGSTDTKVQYDPLINGFELKGTPQLLNLSPNEGIAGQEIEFNISAYNTFFEDAEELNAELIRNNDSFDVNLTVINDTELFGTLIFPYSAEEGTYYLKVTNEYDGEMLLFNAFVLSNSGITPQILEVAPDSIPQDATSNISILGEYTNFDFGGNNTVWIEQNGVEREATQVSVSNDEVIIASINTADLEVGEWDVFVENDIDGMLFLYDALTIYHIDGIDEYKSDISFNLYPNPCNNIVNISLENPESTSYKIHVLNSLGKVISYDQTSQQNLELNLENLESGVYFIRISDGRQYSTQKLFVR